MNCSINISICRLHKDSSSSCRKRIYNKCISFDRHICRTSWFIPSLCIIGNINRSHPHVVKHIISNLYFSSCCAEYATSRSFFKNIIMNLHIRCVCNVFHRMLINLYSFWNRFVKCKLNLRQIVQTSFATFSIRSVHFHNFSHCNVPIFRYRNHIPQCWKFYLISHIVIRESSRFIMFVLHSHFCSVITNSNYLQECTMNIDWVIMWVRKCTVWNINQSFTAWHLNEIRVTFCCSSRCFVCLKIHIFHCNIFRELPYHTKSMNKTNI